MSDTITRIQLGNREIILLGTAHVSQESVEEVKKVITEEKPSRVCVEIDSQRYASMSQAQSWSNLNIGKVIRQGKGFMLMANLALSSFQRRMGADLGLKPGEEMKAAIQTSEELGIPFSFCDREIQSTLNRAWKKSNLWNKAKLLAALIASVFEKEKLSAEQIEDLKKKSELHSMMNELATYLPSVKEVLIDERDQYLAAKIFDCPEEKIVAVVGAGHVPGISEWLAKFQAGTASTDVTDIESVPKPGIVSKLLPWVFPLAIVGILVFTLVSAGWDTFVSKLGWFALLTSVSSAFGALVGLGHPLTILLAFICAPFTSMTHIIKIGMVTGVSEVYVRKPRVKDFEAINEDMAKFTGFFKNRVIHALVVILSSEIFGSIGFWVATINLIK